MTTKKTLFPLLLFTVLTLLSSCLKEQEAKLEVYCDAYFRKTSLNNVDKYVPVYYVYSNNDLASVTVTLPSNGGNVSLSPLDDKRTFSKNFTINDYVATRPTAGSYQFSITSAKSEIQQLNDILTSDEISVPVVTEAVYKTANSGISVKWNPVSGANAYLIKLFAQSGEQVFSSPLYANTRNELIIEQAITGWLSGHPVPNTTYTLEVHAFKFEDGFTDQNYMFNVQCNSFISKSVSWNP